MRQLSGCDFCGGTASGTFEVLPARVDPEGKGKRMLLCDHCRDALASILDPLLDAKMADVEPDVAPDRRLDAEPTDVGATGGAPGDSTSGDSASDDGAPDDAPTDDPSADASTTDESSDGGSAAGSATNGSAADESTDAAAERSSDSKMAATGAGSSSRVPRGYRKVLRFLENREFPVERAEAVEVTAGAYGMDEEAVEAAIDHAVKHERLKSFDGELREV